MKKETLNNNHLIFLSKLVVNSVCCDHMTLLCENYSVLVQQNDVLAKKADVIKIQHFC